jgi:CheY-like chemotaxis protein
MNKSQHLTIQRPAVKPFGVAGSDFWNSHDALRRRRQQRKDAAVKERILVVDDQREIADALTRLLQTLGYEAKAVYDGPRAVDEAADFLPDLMFIDIGMPGIDGYKTVARIRGHRECAHVILIALTGWGRPEDRQRAYESGFDLHITKPMNIDKLMEVLALIDPKGQTLSPAGRIYQMQSALSKGA